MKMFVFSVKPFNRKGRSRRVKISSRRSLYQLAKEIIRVNKLSLDHCFGFFSKVTSDRYLDSEKQYELFTDLIEKGEDIEPTGAESVKKTDVDQVWTKPGDRMLFLFDYGETILWVIQLEKVVS